MLSRSDTTMVDSRGNSVPLRPDPEGVWRHRRSFQLDFGRTFDRWKKHPRVMFVLAGRAVSELDCKPEHPRDVLWTMVWQGVSGVVAGAVLYAIVVRDFFGNWNWGAISITLMVCVMACVIGQAFAWRRSERQYRRIRRVIAELPPYCPGCWYPLGDRVEEDGCTLCPECGGAWRIYEPDPDACSAS